MIDPRVAVLRAAGETRAAEMLEAMGTALEQPQVTAADAPADPTPAVSAMSTPDDWRRAEGEAVLAAMRQAGIIPPAETAA